MVEINRKTTQECRTAMNFDLFFAFSSKEVGRNRTELPGQLKTVLDSTGRAKECETLVLVNTGTGNSHWKYWYWTVLDSN